MATFDSLRGATIAFDLDGTLVDTAPDLVRATNVIMAERGLRPVALSDTRDLVGKGARYLIARAAGLSGVTLGEADLRGNVARFIDVYQAGIADLSRPFPGVEEALDTLAAHGALLSVCTNKPTRLSELLLKELGLIDRFAAIVGADTTPAPKPDGGHVLHAITAAGGNAARAVMVGDSRTDRDAARNAGVPVILVSFGYSDEPPVSMAPEALVDTFDVVPFAAARLLAFNDA